MTRIKQMQDIEASATNVSELPVGFLRQVKSHSTVLVVVSWHTSGSPNSVSFAGCDQFLSASILTRATLPATVLTPLPVYGGPAGNSIGMCAFAVKGQDMRNYQHDNWPSNFIVKLTGTVNRITAHAWEYGGMPGFKFGQAQVTYLNNANAGTFNVNVNTRPYSLELVGAAFATPNPANIISPWPGGDPRELGSTKLANVANSMPFSMGATIDAMAALKAIKDLAASAADKAEFDSQVQGLQEALVDQVYQAFTAPFIQFPGAVTFPTFPEGVSTASEESVGAWLNWLNDQALVGFREEFETAYNIAIWAMTADIFGGVGPYQVAFNPIYVENPALLSLWDGAGPEPFVLVRQSALNGTQVILSNVNPLSEVTDPNDALDVQEVVTVWDLFGSTDPGLDEGFVSDTISNICSALVGIGGFAIDAIRALMGSGGSDSTP